MKDYLSKNPFLLVTERKSFTPYNVIIKIPPPFAITINDEKNRSNCNTPNLETIFFLFLIVFKVKELKLCITNHYDCLSHPLVLFTTYELYRSIYSISLSVPPLIFLILAGMRHFWYEGLADGEHRLAGTARARASA